MTPSQVELIQRLAEISQDPTQPSTKTQEQKPEMLQALDGFNNLLESATNWLFFGRFTPTSLL